MQVARDHYYRLASDVPDERVKAAAALLKDLANADSPDEWNYALERLIKGLSTTRQAARFGFSMALTELIAALIPRKDHDLTVSSYLTRVLELNDTKSNMKGKEERATLFGRLFGLQSLLNSQSLSDRDLTSDDDLKRFVDSLFELALAKSWLRETSVFTLCKFVTQVGPDASIMSYILQKTNDLGLNLSTEGIAIYLSIPHEVRQKAFAKLSSTKGSWKNGDPLSKGNLPALAKALKDIEVVSAPEEKNPEIKQKGSWSPRVHFVWDNILQLLLQAQEEPEKPTKKRKLNSHNSQTDDKISIKEFWQVVIDETMFSEKASHERKYWGFEILQKAIPLANAEDITSLLSRNLLRCLINQAAQSNRLLNKASLKVLNAIKDECLRNPNKAAVFLSHLTDESAGGRWNFDFITKSKTTESLVSILGKVEGLSTKQTRKILKDIQTVLTDRFETAYKTDETATSTSMNKPNDNIEIWCLNALFTLIKTNKPLLDNPKIPDAWLEDILKLFIKHSFFEAKDSTSVSIRVRNLCQERLNSILGQVVSVRRESGSWPLFCVQYIKALEASEELQLLQELDEELIAVKQECLTTLETVESFKESQESQTKVYCFELLFSMVLLQIYMGDEDAFAVVDELKVCFESSFSQDEDSDIDSSVILTEIILSFVSKKSGLLRKFSLIIWEALLCQTDENGVLPLNDECLQLLFDVLEARENKEGQQSLFEGEDEHDGQSHDEDSNGEERSHDEDSQDEEDNHSEHSHSEDEDGDKDKDSSDSSSEEEEQDGEDEENQVSKIDKETNLKLAAALGIPTESSGEVKFADLSSEDEDDSHYESESMDDEQMMAMDNQLSKIFKERRDILSNTETGNKRKNEVAEAREQMIFFKHRVLDLLEIFSKAQPRSFLNFKMIRPLIVLINLTLDKNVGSKAQKLLKSRISKVKLEEISSDKKSELETELFSLLNWLHDQLRQAKYHKQPHQQACSQASILVSKTLVSMDAKSIDHVIDTYSATLKQWATDSKLKFQHTIFLDLVNWLNSRRG